MFFLPDIYHVWWLGQRNDRLQFTTGEIDSFFSLLDGAFTTKACIVNLLSCTVV